MLFAAIATLSACSFNSPSAGSGPTDAGGVSDTGTTPPDACKDDDGDGVCNVVDQCPGMDDTKDTDGDGIPDCLDDWPCGAKPTAPKQSIDNRDFFGVGWKVDDTSLGGSNLTLATITSGATVNVTLTYTLGVGCIVGQQCSAEFKYGDDVDGVDDCIVHGTYNNPTFMNNVDWSASLTFKSVTKPTVFKIKLDTDGSSSCQKSWQGGTPGDSSTIAEVCVTP